MKRTPDGPRTLLLWPPGPMLYDNLCYHYCSFGEIAGYLDLLTPLEVIDAGIAYRSLNELARQITRFQPELVILYHDFDLLSYLPPTVNLLRAVSEAKIVTYGTPGMYCPLPFLEKGVDGVAWHGDWEYALASFIQEPGSPAGILTAHSRIRGSWIPATEWGFPLLEKLPLEAYKNWGREALVNTERAGLPGLTELSITLSRGCGRRCAFCKTPLVEGMSDRRRDLSAAVAFITKAFHDHAFDYFSVYSPNFTLDREYAIHFAHALKRHGLPWKCVTSLDLLDAELVQILAEGGCRRISVGVETFSPRARELLGIRKGSDFLPEIAAACWRHALNLNCFLMLGIPGEERAAFVDGVRRLVSSGASVRITSYVPHQEITESSTWDDLVRLNRKTYCCALPEGMSREEFREIIFNQDSWLRRILREAGPGSHSESLPCDCHRHPGPSLPHD